MDKGYDFPDHVGEQLVAYGEDMWLFRENPDRETTRELSLYRGERRGYAASFSPVVIPIFLVLTLGILCHG